MFRKTNIRKNKKIQFVLLPILVLFVVAIVFFTIEMSTLGAQLVELENEEARLIKEKQGLSVQLIDASSLSEVGKKAEELGFKKPSDVVYISEKEAVAKLP